MRGFFAVKPLRRELGQAQRAELMEHLAACPACREVYGEMMAMHEAFLELDTPAPPMFRMGAGYLTSNANPALHTALDILRDSRIPLDY